MVSVERIKFLLRRALDLRLPDDGVTIKVGMDTREDYHKDQRNVIDRMDRLARVRDNATTLILVIGFLGVVVMVLIATRCRECATQPQIIGVVSGLGVLLVAAGAQLILAVRARVDGLLVAHQRWLDRIEKKGRVQLLGGRSRWFPMGAFHAGALTNVGGETCIVSLPGSIQAIVTTDTPRMYSRDSWSVIIEDESDLVGGVTLVAISKSWNAPTLGPPRTIRLGPGESKLVGIGVMWGTQTPSEVVLQAGFPVIDGYGEWVDVKLPPGLLASPDNQRLTLDWRRRRSAPESHGDE